MPRACMEFNDVVMTIGDYQYNEFRNSNWGIYAVRSMLKVQKGRFYNMNKGGSLYGSAAHKGSAIVAESKTAAKAGKLQVADCLIDTCEHGIYTEWTTADINNVNALHVTGNGSYHLYCNSVNMSTYVGACNIVAGKSGIVFQNSEQATMTAKNNTIKVTTGGSSVGIKIIATNSNAGNYVLKGNVIEAANGNGITVNFAKNATIFDNMIKLSGNTINGIALTGCDSSTVSCNTVIGRYPAVNYQNKGIYGSMNQKCYISCNITDSLYKGVHFSSSNIATKFRGNEMKKHYIGLYLDNTAVIDTQSHAGNMWTGTYNSTYGAWNENDSLTSQLFASLFIVDPVLGAFYNPNIPLGINPGEPNDQGWFDQIVGGNTYSCTGSLLCADKPIERSQGSGNLKEAIASGDVLTTDYIDESKSTAKLFLFEDLKKDSLLFSNNPVLMQFLSNNATSVFGKLNNTKQLMQESFTIDSLYILQINEKDSLLKIHLNNVKTLDSLAAADSTIENLTVRENEIDIIANIQQDINNILSITIANKVAKLNDATTWNNAVQPNEIPEYNLKQVNDINIIYEQTNSNDSIIQFYGTLLNIAEQCPQSGGMAVYVARSLVALFNDTIVYDDDNVCLQQGYFRLAQKENKKSIPSDIAIIPNPADEMTQIILSKKQEGVCKVSITDAYSKSVYTKEFDCKTQHLTISTKGLVQGIYFVEIKINGSTVKTAKLIIAR
ncbi:MAG: T9SS type A sorting domain-containing protein [Bacteroidia bacterium]|nr:T9SS type A sorting domain-containing protein [Bacteroidia bacterium]HRF15076.1 T9SS type A sorting domain-containing protein [Bacteroidia bacterium]